MIGNQQNVAPRSARDSLLARAHFARWWLYLVFLGLGALVWWAAVAEIQELARAQGQVIAVARTQLIQAADGGVLAKLFVQEGAKVGKGDILAQLDDSRAQAAYADSRAKVAALRATLARLRAEVYGGQPKFDKELSEWPAYVANQRALFVRKQQALNEGVKVLDNSLRLIRKELRVNEPLLKSGDVGQVEILRLQRQESELLGQIVNVRNKYFQDAQVEMNRAEEDLNTQEQMLSERATLLEHTELRAPMDGLVKRIQITTLGAAVRAGDTLMELVPLGSGLIVETKFATTDMAFLRVGLPAQVKFDAYDYSVYGQASGVVTYISPDTLTENDPRVGERAYYRVHIRIDKLSDKRVKGRSMEVHPGMTAQVEVLTAERTVLSYLFKPIAKTLSESMTER